MPNVNQEVLTIIISIGVSALMTGIYWFGKTIRSWVRKGHTFREYKKYLTDNEKSLFFAILTHMCEKDTWLARKKRTSTESKKVDFQLYIY